MQALSMEAMALDEHLAEALSPDPLRDQTSAVVLALAEAGAAVAELLADPDADDDIERRVRDIFMRGLRAAPVGAIAAPHAGGWEHGEASADLAVAIAPAIDQGSVEASIPVGAIFSILRRTPDVDPFTGDLGAPVAAGFFVHGARTRLVLTLGDGVDVFTLYPRGDWRRSRAKALTPAGTQEFAIDAANSRHWDDAIRLYIDDCIKGADGPRGRNFTMRWTGSLVGEALRILTRGGVYLDPADQRPEQREGRASLLFEARPIAFVMEQAGGKASTGRERILDRSVVSLDQTTPLIFGAAAKVDRILRLHASPEGRAERSPLFGRRGLFRN
jgi:fructose-1,6-bisphosphatase I